MNRDRACARFSLGLNKSCKEEKERMSEGEGVQRNDAVTDRVLTVPNVISFTRLLMAPIALGLLLTGNDIAAALLFGVSAATDFVDGQIARRTNQVSRVGQLLDPAVDRVLIVVLARDVFLLWGGSILLKNFKVRVPVVYSGKVATTFLFFGLFGLMINMPIVGGLGLCDISWLPGFNGDPCSWGIWAVYLGLTLSLFTTVYYVRAGAQGMKNAKESSR